MLGSGQNFNRVALVPLVFAVVAGDAFDGDLLPHFRGYAGNQWDTLGHNEVFGIVHQADVGVSVAFLLDVGNGARNLHMGMHVLRHVRNGYGPVDP